MKKNMQNEIIHMDAGRTHFLASEGEEMAFQITFSEGSREMPPKLTTEVISRRRRKNFCSFLRKC